MNLRVDSERTWSETSTLLGIHHKNHHYSTDGIEAGENGHETDDDEWEDVPKKLVVDSSDAASHKAIGMLGSLAIAVNSLAGPAILQLPAQYQQSGIIPTTACLLLVATLSVCCSLHMANTVSKITIQTSPNAEPRHNGSFDACVEFSDVFGYFWNRKWYVITQVLFFLTATVMNVAAIVDTAETVDSALGFHAATYGYSLDNLQFVSWSHHGQRCTRRQVKLGECDAFSDEGEYGDYLLTAGYLLTSAVFLPVCLMDLEENTHWQVVGFVILVTLSLYFCYDLSHYPLRLDNIQGMDDDDHHSNPWWGHSYSSMLGVILFNFSLVLAIPAWLHEKRPTVSVTRVVHGSTAISTCLYIAVGLLGALAIPNANVNMLSPMQSGAYGTGMQIASSVFAFFIIGLDIPLFSVLTRYNLTHSGLCSDRTANLFVVWLPWAVSWAFYQGDAIGQLLDWGGVLFMSAVAFLLPLYISLKALKSTEYMGSIRVYGSWFRSYRAQVIALHILLLVAVVSVVLAIIGQIVAVEEKAAYTSSIQYLNSTTIWDLLHEHAQSAVGLLPTGGGTS